MRRKYERSARYVLGSRPMSEPGRKNPHAVALGRKGGKARAEAVPPEQLSEIGRAGVEKRRLMDPEQRREIARKAGQASAAKRRKKPAG